MLWVLVTSPVLGGDVTAPGDAIIAIDVDGNSSYPDPGEAPGYAIDNTTSKYLNFGGANSGFIVTPTVGPTVATSFRIMTANDISGRTPTGWELYGTNDTIVSTDNSTGEDENWTLIGSDDIDLGTGFHVWGPVVYTASYSTFYTSYKVVFPGVQTPGYEMQIGEFELNGQTAAQAHSVSPVHGESSVLSTALLQWKVPRDPTNVTLPDTTLDIDKFFVFGDPNETRLRNADVDDYSGVPYYSEQALTGLIGDDPVQSFDPSPDLTENSTYYWRVDTRLVGYSEPNEVITGAVWTFDTNIFPEDVSVEPVLVDFGAATGVMTVTATNPPGGGTMSYQWYRDDVPGNPTFQVELTDGAEYSGVETANLTVVSPTTGYPLVGGDEGFYFCRVSNDGGTVDSNSARMAIKRRTNYYELETDLTDSAIGYDAVLTTGGTTPSYVTGQVGNAIELYGDAGGIVDLMQFSTDPYPTTGQQITVTAWVYAETKGEWGSIVKNWADAGGMIHLGLNSTGDYLEFQMEEADYESVTILDDTVFPTGEWQFVAAVADGSQLHLYRMGADEVVTNRHFEVAVGDYDGTLNSTLQWAGIGVKPAQDGSGPSTGAPAFWDGKLDDIQIYNYGLSTEEVVDIYGSSVCLYTKDPLPAWYDADLNNDCTVSLGDFAVLAGEWLDGGVYTP